MVGIRPGVAIAASLAFVAVCTPSAVAQPPPGLTESGRTVWEFEALLHDTFNRLPVSAHYDQGVDWRFAACHLGCAPLAYWGIYFFTFKNARGSAFHLSTRRTLIGFGNYPIPIKVRGRFVACNRPETKFLITYGSAAGLGLACLATHS
jgi:hypothetical protein